MAILDVFKTKPAKSGQNEKKTEKEISGDVKIAKEEKNAPIIEKKAGKKDFSQIAARILKAPHITEKAINMGQDNKYVFKVSPEGNKSEVKKAVSELYGVNVVDVNIINIPKKKRRLGQNQGFKSGYKKAVVTLAEGEKIETGI
ncbi:MAG: 50S ribosomal protein L23 [Parcubacteria group bacterium GW2011_GWF2_39_13b]|nr:MAG: 50S ribosomal protein L23 [Parcubacteria group bacterium GW2011_GWF2_39_13b]